jgi:hypothetical protein
MTVQNLQNLVLRAAFNAGVRAIGQDSKALNTADMGYPARVLSLPWHPLPGPYAGSEPFEGHRRMSMDTLDRRAGRSAGSAGDPGQIGFARLRGATILFGWSASGETVQRIPMGCKGCLGRFEPTPTAWSSRQAERVCG